MSARKKILLTFYFGPSGLPLGHSCADGFRQLGWDVCCVDTHHESPFYRHVVKRYNKLLKALGLKKFMVQGTSHPWAPLPYRCSQLRDAVADFKPDVVLVFNPVPNLYPTEFLLKLREEFRFKLIGWNVDGPYEDLITLSKKDAPLFDRYFCIHQFGYSDADRIKFLPAYALDSKRYFKMPGVEPAKHKVVFVGAWSPRREEYLRAIADLPLEIYGTDWRRKGSPETKRRVVANRVWGGTLNRLMNQSKIVLNISSWVPEKTGLSLRIVDIPATGAFMLTDDSPELEQVFGKDMNIPVFTDPSDFRSKVIYFLNADQMRNEIASRMHAHIQQYSTYADRMRLLTQE